MDFPRRGKITEFWCIENSGILLSENEKSKEARQRYNFLASEECIFFLYNIYTKSKIN